MERFMKHFSLTTDQKTLIKIFLWCVIATLLIRALVVYIDHRPADCYDMLVVVYSLDPGLVDRVMQDNWLTNAECNALNTAFLARTNQIERQRKIDAYRRLKK